MTRYAMVVVVTADSVGDAWDAISDVLLDHDAAQFVGQPWPVHEPDGFHDTDSVIRERP
jgi:hypothetical protein